MKLPAKRLSTFDFRLLTMIFLTFALTSCDVFNPPSEIEWNNPLDINNPVTHGDPYKLQGEIVDYGVCQQTGAPGCWGRRLQRAAGRLVGQ